MVNFSMNRHTITITEVQEQIANGIMTFSKKDDSPRGCRVVSASDIKVGDEIIINNYFTLVTE